VGVYTAAARTGSDVLILPKGFASFIRRPPMPLVTYVHDTMLQYYARRYPSAFPILERTYFDACLRATARHSSLILTNSEFTASELREAVAAWGSPLPRIVPVGIGVAAKNGRRPQKSGRILVLLSRFPHKRTQTAIEYLSRWDARTGWTGGADFVGSLPEGITLPERNGWKLHPRLSEAEYELLVSSAQALVYFTEYEGFGLPPVEAIAAGTAPVYSAIPATTEAMRGAGFPFDLTSYESFAVAMSAAVRATDSQIEEWAGSLLRRHHWDTVTSRVIDAILQLVSPGSAASPAALAGTSHA
jgi:hypothetical protein